MTFPCIIPCVPEDYLRMHDRYIRLFEYLSISELIFIGPESLKEYVQKDIFDGLFGDGRTSFLDEKELVVLGDIKPVYDEIFSKCTQTKPSSVNWYYQQFLKMAYARICKGEYYLCWDSDTVPLRDISMFDAGGKPYLDVKKEFNDSYFLTIQKLIGCGKLIEKSFISEHMLFNKEYMLELIDFIESRDIEGKNFCEKILNAVGADNLNTGFSEFETYGTWIGLKHSSAYTLRNWFSFRNANFFVDVKDLNDEDTMWLAKDYDAASFEKYQTTVEELTELFRTPRYREKLTPRQFYTSVLESGIMGDYVDGAISVDGKLAPV